MAAIMQGGYVYPGSFVPQEPLAYSTPPGSWAPPRGMVGTPSPPPAMMPQPGMNGAPSPMQTMSFAPAPQAQAQAPFFDDGSSAPFLHQYFQMVKSALAIQPLTNKAAVRELNGKLFPIIVEAFKRHDKDGDLVLNKNEAYLFFSHFVSERLGFHETASGLGARSDKEKAADLLANYKRNKASIDAAAFKVFSADEEGYLQMHEVVQALSLGTSKHQELLRAFGFHGDGEDDDDATYYADHYA